ncbi:MAG: YebC/PmpR family DNA-binding transcriptional regulator [Dehalococcoidia bacterium]|nr:MAG: YebC/PmpR family DNA-binding transcriptional regulator [Dehalococcoidia bacterium]
MSGHSKWAQIKRQKGVADARRGQVFTKLTREIMLAARTGGGSLESNYQLRLVVQKAKDSNMPSENIDRAIKRGVGGGEGTNLVEIMFEGYGMNGVAVLIEALTDNRNRTVQEVRSTLTRHGGSLGETGCVAWLFDTRGVITVDASEGGADDIALQAIDAGAEDVKTEGDYVEVYTETGVMEDVRQALESSFKVVSAEVSRVPKTTVMLDDSKAGQMMSFLDQLEQLDDVQRVFSNADFSDTALQGLQQA